MVIWDRATGHKLREIPVAGYTLPWGNLRFSPDGKRLFGSLQLRHQNPDRLVWTMYAWDVGSGAEAKDIPSFPAQVRPLGYSQDAQEVILLNNHNQIVRWNIEKGKERGRYTQPESGTKAAALVGERLLLPRFDGQAVSMWEAGQKKQLWSVKTTRHKEFPDLPMAFSADGKLFAVEAPPRVVSIHDSLSGKLVRQFKRDGVMIYHSLCFTVRIANPRRHQQ